MLESAELTSAKGEAHGILVEVRPKPAEPGAPDVGDLTHVFPVAPEEFVQRVGELGDSLRDIAARLTKRLDELVVRSERDWRLDEVELTFSLDLEAEAGVIIARTKGSAGFEAKLTWKAPSTEHPA